MRALCDINALNLAIYFASTWDCCTMKATVDMFIYINIYKYINK